MTSTASSPHWVSLIAYLCIYFICLIGVTIIGWALHHAKPNISSHNDSIAWSQYFILIREKSRILLSLSIHIIIGAFNFCVMISFIFLSKYEMYSSNDLNEICIISLLSFILYRFGSAILIWKLSHSVRKSVFQLIDITILYQLLNGYKKKTLYNTGRIVEYIFYLNGMLQSWIQCIVQLVFLMKRSSLSYSFIYIILIAFILNLYCVIKCIYNKDMLLSSETYRETKSIQQITTHSVFRFIDVSLRVIILSMLWITIGFVGAVLIVSIEFFIVAYLAYFTKEMQRLQEMVAVILHITHVVNTFDPLDNDGRSRPVTPYTIRKTYELQVILNVDIEEVEKQEKERRRKMMRECECFKWRIIGNIIYIAVFGLISIFEYKEYAESTLSIVLTIYCIICAVLYPFIYWILKNSNRWRRTSVSHPQYDEGDIFGYLQRNDFESAKEILDFGKTINIKQWMNWSNQWDFSDNNDPNSLINFLYQQNIKLNSIIHKSQGGLNILHQICKNPELKNAKDTIELLIKYGFHIDGKTQKREDSPLHIACSYCNKSVMMALLNNENGSELLFVKNRSNQTPLHSLMIGYDKKYVDNQISMTSILFNTYNAQQIVLDIDVHGQSALHIACLNKWCPIEIIRLLLLHGAYRYQADNDGFYPKDHLQKWDERERDDIDLVLKWLNKGLNPNDDNELTPLKNTSQNAQSYVEVCEHDEEEEVPIRMIFQEISDDDDEGGIDPHNMVTPLDPSPVVSFDHDDGTMILAPSVDVLQKVNSKESENEEQP